MTGAGALRERVAFDGPSLETDDYGSETRTWTEGDPVAAEFRHLRGDELRQPGGQTGQAAWKVRVRSSTATRAITTEHRMRDVRRGVAFNVTSVDAISDRANVWLVVEAGVAI